MAQKSKFQLPTSYLSYSAWWMWLTDKNEYKRRYFEGIKQEPNKYLEFGRKVDEAITTQKTDDEKLRVMINFIPRYPVMQAELAQEYKGLKLFGKMDTFDPETLAFRDYKTSKNNWTQRQADASDQLTFYTMLIAMKHRGRMPASTHIDWIETTEDENGEMQVTGRVKEFATKRTLSDLAAMSKSVIQVAEEISEHYKKFLASIT